MSPTEFRTGVIKPFECVKEGWELIKSDYWLLFAITLVGAIIGGVTMYILLGAMACGIFIAYLKKIDGQLVAFDDLWAGMKYFGPGFVVMLAMIVPMIVVYALVYVPILAATIMGQRMGEEEIMAMVFGILALDFVLIVLMVCFHTLLMFAFPLIVDRQLGGIAAIKTSIISVWKNLSGVAGLVGVNFLLTLLGYAALCFGLYFVIPIMIAGTVVAYRKVFPHTLSPNFAPPPPNAYRGL